MFQLRAVPPGQGHRPDGPHAVWAECGHGRPFRRLPLLAICGPSGAGKSAVAYLIESMHGAGSPAAQRIMIGRLARLEDKIDQVKHILSINR